MKTLEPFGDYLVVMPLDASETTKGGIHLPVSAMDKQGKIAVRGEVLAIGPGRLMDSGALAPMDSDLGDTVVFNPFGGTEFEVAVGSPKLLLISERDVIARVVEVPSSCDEQDAPLSPVDLIHDGVGAEA